MILPLLCHLVLTILSFFIIIFLYQNCQFIFIILILLATIIMVLWILARKVNPTYKISWLVFLILTPGIGIIIYLLTHLQIGSNYLIKRLNNLEKDIKYKLPNNPVLDKDLVLFSNYMYKIGNFPTYNADDCQYFDDGKTFFDDLLVELNKAKQSIYIESYIISNGFMFNELLKILISKSKMGLDVRVIYDGWGSLPFHISKLPKMLKKMA